MRFVLRVCCALLICFALAGAAQEPDRLLQARLQAHISFLADDLLLGRQPGSAGYNIAANYVASQFRQMGLLPAGTGDTYFQPVPLRQALLEPDSAELIIKQGDKDTVLVFADQFYMGPSLGSLASDLEAGMIFVGFGIDAPELGHSDYTDINVQGKVVVLLAGQPHDFPSEEGAHFASTTEKTRAAVRGG
ncbi:MAG: peptidase M28, partial [Gammaproteobacteria bacterium]|nr:peptidase M28 [Gammaproteobacteria bacterium]